MEYGDGMAVFYVISDVHGFYNEMREALDDTGFNPDDKNSWLVVLGDYTDRGPDPDKVISYLRSLPRKILVKGNHEDLLLECCERGVPYSHDFSNGTYNTICKLGNYIEGYSFDECCDRTLARIHLFIDEMVDYFETEHFVFCHSWIPVICKDGLPAYYTKNRKFEFNPNWRNASEKDWQDARWGNPFDLATSGLNKTGKKLLHGHWGNSYYWAKEKGLSEYGDDACFDICTHDSCIGLDTTTVVSGKVNVLIIQDEFLENPLDK